ncbi:MAG: hypothetical protein OHK0040_10460 [bacterium]
MKYQVLSRRYRPKTFDEVIGQQSIVKLLKNALSSKKIPHAFLFTGIRGTGKTTTARIFARALNCEKGIVENPCNECSACLQLLEGRNMDVFEIDGASNTSVNDVRMLKENTRFLPSQSRYKIYIIDEVHMLSTEAFNALLKTLEEPPEYVVFILATTEPQKIPETVLSRCIRLNFKRVEPKEVADYLGSVLKEEGISYDESALYLIARRSEGSVRDALSLLELVLAYGDGYVREDDVNTVLGLLSRNKIFEILKLFAKKDGTGILRFLGDVKQEGADLFNLLENIIFYLRHLVMYSMNIPFDVKEFSESEVQELKEIYEKFSKEELIVYYQGLRQVLEQLRFSPYPQYDIEVGLLKLVILKDFLEYSPTFPAKAEEKKITVNGEQIKDSAKPEKGEPTYQKTAEKKDVQDFLKFLHTKKPVLASQFGNAKVALENGVFSITYSSSHDIFYEHIKSEEEQSELKALLKEFFGYDVKIEINMTAETATSENNHSLKDLVHQNPAVNLILSEFAGAKIVAVRENKEAKLEIKEEEDTVEKGEETDE